MYVWYWWAWNMESYVSIKVSEKLKVHYDSYFQYERFYKFFLWKIHACSYFINTLILYWQNNNKWWRNVLTISVCVPRTGLVTEHERHVDPALVAEGGAESVHCRGVPDSQHALAVDGQNHHSGLETRVNSVSKVSCHDDGLLDNLFFSVHSRLFHREAFKQGGTFILQHL